MTKKTQQSLSERAVEAQANKINLADELGLTKEEFKTISAFAALIAKRMDAAPIEPLLSAAEFHIGKRFPNNAEAVEVIDADYICTMASSYVEKSSMGYSAGNMEKPAPIDDAKSKFARASTRVTASPGDKDREVSYAKQLRWLTQMQVQQAYKDALNPVFQAVYWIHTGQKYNAPDRTQEAVSADESLAILMS